MGVGEGRGVRARARGVRRERVKAPRRGEEGGRLGCARPAGARAARGGGTRCAWQRGGSHELFARGPGAAAPAGGGACDGRVDLCRG